MLTAQQNELITRVGPGTKMGAALRRYWTPALEASEIPTADCDPVRIRLLGEDLLAFRDSQGRVGVLDDRCCHRGASLSLGRNEQGGIRCLYHGWKFDVAGNILEAPNVDNPERLAKHLKQPAYKVRESHGLIWVYMGPPEKEPPFPNFSWMSVPAAHRTLAACHVNANYVQLQEGLLDTTHFAYLHRDLLERKDLSDTTMPADQMEILKNPRAKIEVERTPYGFDSASLRKKSNGKIEARINCFFAPYGALSTGDVAFTLIVPADDENSVFYTIPLDRTREIAHEAVSERYLAFGGVDRATREKICITRETKDRADRPSFQNRFYQDREAMRRGETFSGLRPNFLPEDFAIARSQGPIADRTIVHVMPSDIATVSMWKLLREIAETVDSGGDPIGVHPPASLPHIHSIAIELAEGEDWRTAVSDHFAP